MNLLQIAFFPWLAKAAYDDYKVGSVSTLYLLGGFLAALLYFFVFSSWLESIPVVALLSFGLLIYALVVQKFFRNSGLMIGGADVAVYIILLLIFDYKIATAVSIISGVLILLARNWESFRHPSHQDSKSVKALPFIFLATIISVLGYAIIGT